jgi:ribosomal-protein-alanine N-acetyltransferase
MSGVRMANVVMDCASVAKLASFWSAVTGYRPAPGEPPWDDPEWNDAGWVTIRDPEGRAPKFAFQGVPEGEVVKNRVHLDLMAEDEEAEAAKIQELGATFLRRSDNPEDPFVTLADPEGNEFDVIRAPEVSRSSALPLPDPPLSDGTVTLRLPEERDLEAMERGINDPEVVRWFGQPELPATEISELNRERWRSGWGATFAIYETDDRCVGYVWVNLSKPRKGSIGYSLLPEARGRGLATRSVRLVARWAFDELGLARLALHTEPRNEASRRVAERCGFRLEGILRSYEENDGRRVDHMVFSLLPGELT